MSKKQHDMEQDKKNILKDFENGEFEAVDNLDEEMQLAKKAASQFQLLSSNGETMALGLHFSVK